MADPDVSDTSDAFIKAQLAVTGVDVEQVLQQKKIKDKSKLARFEERKRQSLATKREKGEQDKARARVRQKRDEEKRQVAMKAEEARRQAAHEAVEKQRQANIEANKAHKQRQIDEHKASELVKLLIEENRKSRGGLEGSAMAELQELEALQRAEEDVRSRVWNEQQMRSMSVPEAQGFQKDVKRSERRWSLGTDVEALEWVDGQDGQGLVTTGDTAMSPIVVD